MKDEKNQEKKWMKIKKKWKINENKKDSEKKVKHTDRSREYGEIVRKMKQWFKKSIWKIEI